MSSVPNELLSRSRPQRLATLCILVGATQCKSQEAGRLAKQSLSHNNKNNNNKALYAKVVNTPATGLVAVPVPALIPGVVIILRGEAFAVSFAVGVAVAVVVGRLLALSDICMIFTAPFVFYGKVQSQQHVLLSTHAIAPWNMGHPRSLAHCFLAAWEQAAPQFHWLAKTRPDKTRQDNFNFKSAEHTDKPRPHRHSGTWAAMCVHMLNLLGHIVLATQFTDLSSSFPSTQAKFMPPSSCWNWPEIVAKGGNVCNAVCF